MSINVSSKLSEWFSTTVLKRKSIAQEMSTTEEAPLMKAYSVDINNEIDKCGEKYSSREYEDLPTAPPTSIMVVSGNGQNWDRFRDEIFSSLNWRSIEIGEPTEAEYIIDDLIRETTPKDTMEWAYNIFLNNTDNILLLCTLIHSLSHIEYELVYPQGPMMAMAMFAHDDKRVVGYAIKAFSNWNSKDSLKYIEHMQPKEIWAKREMNRIIEYIKMNGDEIDDIFDEKNHTTKMDTRTA